MTEVNRKWPAAVALEDVPCPLGCSSGDDQVLTGWDRLNGLPGEFRVVRCRLCGLMRTNPRPTRESIGFYYPESYGPYRTSVPPERHALVIPRWKRPLRRLIELNMTRLPAIAPGRLLEIGCATGTFLARMAAEGWDVQGIEFSSWAAERVRVLGYPVHAGPLDSAPEPRLPYDLTIGWMVLEHLYDPIEELRRLRRWTKPGGWLALSVPNAGSLEFRSFGNAWYALQLPTHLFHFTPDSISKTLEAAGWRVRRIFHQRNLANLIASLGYVLEDRGLSPQLAHTLVRVAETSRAMLFGLYPLACAAAALGQTGRILVWADRPEC